MSHNTVTLATGCKVNFFLKITGTRADGYHTLESVFYPLSEPSDTMHLDFKGQGYFFQCEEKGLDPEENTVTKAYRAFSRKTGFRPGLCIRLVKGVPSGAGLGGGSADAAALLLALNARAGEKALQEAELNALGTGIGADVPFFLANRPALIEGIGEKITPLDLNLAGFYLLLVCPPVHVSTPWAYTAYDRGAKKRILQDISSHFLTPGASQFTNTASPVFLLQNDFEDVVYKKYPEILQIKEKLLATGAVAVVMSGSGSSLLGLFRSGTLAMESLRQWQGRGMDVYCHRF